MQSERFQGRQFELEMPAPAESAKIVAPPRLEPMAARREPEHVSMVQLERKAGRSRRSRAKAVGMQAPILRESVIYQGDALRVLRTIPSDSVQCVVTSPPYWGLRDYNVPDQIGLELTLPEFIASLRGVFGEVRRVLRGDGLFWLNIGDGYTSGNRGWRAPDKKNRARAMEVRPDTPLGLKPKDLIGIPWRLAFALQDDGWWLRSDIIWCLSGGTRVYARTQKGDMPTTIKDLVRLDPASVKLWNGEKWTQVLGFSETERPDKTYEIEQ